LAKAAFGRKTPQVPTLIRGHHRFQHRPPKFIRAKADLITVVKNGGIITEAVSTQVWSGESAVHVSL